MNYLNENEVLLMQVMVIENLDLHFLPNIFFSQCHFDIFYVPYIPQFL